VFETKTMRRTALIGLTMAALAGGAVAVAQAPPLAAKLATCQTGAAAADRYAVFTGSMPREDKTVTMAMRFDLFEKQPGGSFQPVALPHWGVWEKTSKKGVPGFIFTKRVEQLAFNAAFRAVVSFRWYDAKGRQIDAARRTSPTCRQPDQRPDLHVKRVVFPTGKGPTKVVVRNRGRGDAAGFAINASRGDLVRGTTVAGLPAGEQVTVGIPLGRCTPGEPVKVTLDPAGVVDEAVEADDTTTVSCPPQR
jgi:hypothetical protein